MIREKEKSLAIKYRQGQPKTWGRKHFPVLPQVEGKKKKGARTFPSQTDQGMLKKGRGKGDKRTRNLPRNSPCRFLTMGGNQLEGERKKNKTTQISPSGREKKKKGSACRETREKGNKRGERVRASSPTEKGKEKRKSNV